MKFEEIITRKEVLKALFENDFYEATEIQEKVIPIIDKGFDVLGQSKTGSGKTLAFALPIIEKIKENKKTQVLILSPTRELSMQIANDISVCLKYLHINITTVYGSSNIMDQIKKLNSGCEIVVGTPGRVKDLIKRGKLVLKEVNTFVLDEADEMLSMGFEEDILSIFDAISHEKQVLLFSATMPKAIQSIAERYMKKDYKQVKIISEDKIPETIVQNYYVVNNNQREEVLSRLLDFYDFSRVMIFTRTKRNADDLYSHLASRGYSCNLIHGDITQEQRIKTLDNFKKNMFKILIATDVAARGIHVDDISLVVNYNLPESSYAYVHRIGRTGRANKSGLSISLVTKGEEKVIRELEKFTKSTITRCEIPTKEDILSNRIKDIDLDKYTKEPKMFVKLDYKKEELENIINNLINEKINLMIGSDFNKDVTIVNKKKERESSDSTRVFLTIGKLDNIQKREFLSFIEKKAGFKEGVLTKVEILSKFTFMSVRKDCYDTLYEKINNVNYNGRTIRIEKAKK